jgi:hypothetical protein
MPLGQPTKYMLKKRTAECNQDFLKRFYEYLN